MLGEIRRQISSIERQARKASHFKRLRESLRVLELSMAAEDRRVLLAEIDTARARLAELNDEVTALEGVCVRRGATQIADSPMDHFRGDFDVVDILQQ